VDASGQVSGTRGEHSILFLGLSTCVWCRRTRQLLEEASVPFEFRYIDLLEGEDKDAALELLSRWNPRRSYPTVVIDNDHTVIGYKPDELKEALDL
jgi:glutaredoxin